MSRIEFVDLKARQRRILPELERRMKDVLRHGGVLVSPCIRI
jgi:hypothetical protein